MIWALLLHVLGKDFSMNLDITEGRVFKFPKGQQKRLNVKLVQEEII